jgi:hypothetical protein
MKDSAIKGILAAAVVILLVVVAYQWSGLGSLRAELELAKSPAEIAKLLPDRSDMIETGVWLHEFYKSADGLQRPQGLWIEGHPDFDGIGAWVLDMYQRDRITGLSKEQARERIVKEIRASEEWKLKHPQ